MWKQSLCRGTIGVHGNVSQRRRELLQRIYVELHMALRRHGKKQTGEEITRDPRVPRVGISKMMMDAGAAGKRATSQ